LSSHACPVVTSAIRGIVRRASRTIVKLFEEGKEAEAQALLSDVRLLIAKVRSEHSDNALRLIIANGMTDRASQILEEYAVGAKRADLLEKVLPPWETAVRWEAVASAGAADSWAFLELPLRRIYEASLSERPIIIENRGLRMLRPFQGRSVRKPPLRQR
jgi:hypothetical protein